MGRLGVSREQIHDALIHAPTLFLRAFKAQFENLGNQFQDPQERCYRSLDNRSNNAWSLLLFGKMAIHDHVCITGHPCRSGLPTKLPADAQSRRRLLLNFQMSTFPFLEIGGRGRSILERAIFGGQFAVMISYSCVSWSLDRSWRSSSPVP